MPATDMQHAMARQAEAERDRRARVISAEVVLLRPFEMLRGLGVEATSDGR